MIGKKEMMQEKFLMFAEKLGVDPEVIGKIKEDFAETKEEMKEEMKEGYHRMPDGSMMKDSDMPDKKVIKVDISKPVEPRMPDEEDIDGMGKEELAVLAKKLLKQPAQQEVGRSDGQQNSPFAIMVKKHGY